MTGPLSAILGFGLFGVFCLAFTEKILPIPPSHVLLLFLGMTAAPNGAALLVLLAVTTLASFAGCLVWYAVGRRIGFDRADHLIEQIGRYVFLRPATYRKLGQAYRRNHVRVSLLAQFIPTVRNYLPIAAGALCLPALPFAMATLLGATIWNAGFLLTGYLLRGSGQDSFTVGLRIIVIVVVLETAFMLALRYGPAWRRRIRLALG
ncbi:alkaline phosphatase [Mesorhizobium sp. WSM4312]|uniref:DedA family protein n=1 Tax=unclassified Mesorhizobium TaxID=325217 RepID=UPI000BAE81D3|nr:MULTISPECIES: DedA family protein [unclassified Mesorhizobium]PBB27104.1 alkaline phosphatase [Mesorhizobium sp. WSM4304]PBB69429.1 alkaline phosphatase [Mesorhizobium sp. WSM4312]PBB76708.1 alkaline phosphatase [Mesorhizobium sp. WSM4308]PBC22573.1 alkaline phosphatase [Mesorhizobium sp. WSM4311]TRC72699.1 DedA family protein [Mesorhizobium sp. WSM4310]